jgi:hypothetical protein
MAKRRRNLKSTTNAAPISIARAVARPDAAATDQPDNLIPAGKIRVLCGGITPMTLFR